MAKAKDEAAGAETSGGATPESPTTAQYQYVGNVISTQAIGGQAVLLAPGAIVSLASADPVTARLLKQRLLVRRG